MRSHVSSGRYQIARVGPSTPSMTRENAGPVIGRCRSAGFSSARFVIGLRNRPGPSYLIDRSLRGATCIIDNEDHDGR